ncbi:protein of unknown function [Ralstonia solanacearum CMR15]|nr:protein of unknown function [Ralstonia solanacearum CMR15]
MEAYPCIWRTWPAPNSGPPRYAFALLTLNADNPTASSNECTSRLIPMARQRRSAAWSC